MSNEQANLNDAHKPTEPMEPTDETSAASTDAAEAEAGIRNASEAPAAEEASISVSDSNQDVSVDNIDPSGQQVATADAFAVDAAIDTAEVKRALEAVLLAASEPMPIQELKRIFDGALSVEMIRDALDELREEWAGRSVELALVASGYRFRIKPDYQKYLDRLSNDKPPRYSRAVLETLAIISYRQPVTRADIEDIRGVAVSPHILKTLEDRGWIDEIGHKDAPGRPALFATTKHFLDDLNLRSLEELPPLHELQATLDMSQAGVVSGSSEQAETPSLPGVAAHDQAHDAEQRGHREVADASADAAEDISTETQTEINDANKLTNEVTNDVAENENENTDAAHNTKNQSGNGASS